MTGCGPGASRRDAPFGLRSCVASGGPVTSHAMLEKTRDPQLVSRLSPGQLATNVVGRPPRVRSLPASVAMGSATRRSILTARRRFELQCYTQARLGRSDETINPGDLWG
jgi:hypothetical protein